MYIYVYNWGEPERAPHVRVVQRARLYIIGASLSEPHTYVKYATAVCMCIYIYIYICIYVYMCRTSS